MAIIKNFYNMTGEQRLDFYDKIKDNNKLVDNDLKETFEEMNREQYNQLKAEVENNKNYLEIFKANMDMDKLSKFIKENQSEQEKSTKDREDITEEERNRFLKAIQEISDTERSYAILTGIKTQNEELKKSLEKESKKFVDTKDVLNTYTSPLKESINDKSLNDSVGMKIKLISLEHNTNLYNNYSNHATSLLNTLEKTMASEQKLTRTDFSNLKAHFFSSKNEEKISLKDYIKMGEEEGNKVKDIFYNLEKGENVNNNLNELKSFLTEKKDGLIETTNSLKDYNEDIKKSLAENNITPEFMMKMWKQGKDGKWVQEEIDLFKELNLKDEKALQQRIEEIQSANKLHMNTNTTGITATSIQKAMDSAFKSNNSEGIGFFNYTVFPYTLMIDLGAAGLNFYSFGKNITQDIKDRKEKNEILKSVSDELSTFDINNLVNKTDNKAILELNEKAKKEGKNLSTIINDYTNEDFEKKLKEANISEEEINTIKENRSVIGEKLGFLTKYQESNKIIDLDLKEQTKVLESFKNGLEKLENSNYDLSKIEDEKTVIEHTKTFLKDLKVQNEEYENIERTYKKQLKDIEAKIKELEEKDSNPNPNPNPIPILNFGNFSFQINNLIEEKKPIEEKLKTIENNKILFNDILSKDFVLEDRLNDLQYTKLISEEVGKENIENVFSQKAEVLAKIHNEESFKNKATELNKNSLIGINNINKVTNGLTKEYLNEQNVQKFDETAKNISEKTGQEVYGLDVATTILANKGKENPLFKHVSQQVNDSLTSFKNEMKVAGKEPTLQSFVNRYGFMDPIDFDSIFKEQFEAFLTNYDEMQKAAKELGLENSMLFKAGKSEEVSAFREKILGFDKALSENLEKSDYSHIIPKKLQNLIMDAKEGEEFLKIVEKEGAKAMDSLAINEEQKENLDKIDETIEKNRKIELEKKEKELQDKKLKEDRDKKESEGMSFGGR